MQSIMMLLTKMAATDIAGNAKHVCKNHIRGDTTGNV